MTKLNFWSMLALLCGLLTILIVWNPVLSIQLEPSIASPSTGSTPSAESITPTLDTPYPAPYPVPYPASLATSSPTPKATSLPTQHTAIQRPILRSPKTVEISNQKPTYYGDGDQDVIVIVTEKITRPAKISNVRNLVMVGGEFTINTPLTADLANNRETIAAHRALALSDISGVAYIEGIFINNSGGGLSEGIQFWSSSGTLALRNSRIEGVRTKPNDPDFAFNHPDLLQVMNGGLLLENVTLSDSDYQGLFIGQEAGLPITSVIFRNVNMSRIARQAWFFHNLQPRVVRNCENCWYDPTGSNRPQDSAYGFWPQVRITNGYAAWDDQSVQAEVRVGIGAPKRGDFAPAEYVGLTYTPDFFQP
jgi:hypothetical protein